MVERPYAPTRFASNGRYMPFLKTASGCGVVEEREERLPVIAYGPVSVIDPMRRHLQSRQGAQQENQRKDKLEQPGVLNRRWFGTPFCRGTAKPNLGPRLPLCDGSQFANETVAVRVNRFLARKQIFFVSRLCRYRALHADQSR